MASTQNEPDSPFRTGKDAPNSSYNAKAEMELAGLLSGRDYSKRELDGKMFYVFDAGENDSKRQAIIVHSAEHMRDPEFVRTYRSTVKVLVPTEGEARIHIVRQAFIDYLLNQRKPAQ